MSKPIENLTWTIFAHLTHLAQWLKDQGYPAYFCLV